MKNGTQGGTRRRFGARAFWSLLVLTLVACGEAGPALLDSGPDDEGVVDEGVDAGGSGGPLEVVELTEPLEDTFLETDAEPALAAYLGDARIVCSGEANHGVDESWRLHIAVARHLAAQGRLSFVEMELARPHALFLDEFVQTGDEEALRGFRREGGGLTAVEGIRDFARAMRALVEDGVPVRLSGVDVSFFPGLSVDLIHEQLRALWPAEAEAWVERLDGTMPILAMASVADALSAALEAAGLLGTELEQARLRRDVLDLAAGNRFLDGFLGEGFDIANATHREPRLGQNAIREADLAAPGGVLVVAHNSHCSHVYDLGPNEDGDPSPAMGAQLTAHYGGDYVTVGQLYGGGRFLLADGRTADWPSVTTSLEDVAGGQHAFSAALHPAAVRIWPDGEPLLAVYRGGPVLPWEEHDAYLYVREVIAATQVAPVF